MPDNPEFIDKMIEAARIAFEKALTDDLYMQGEWTVGYVDQGGSSKVIEEALKAAIRELPDCSIGRYLNNKTVHEEPDDIKELRKFAKEEDNAVES